MQHLYSKDQKIVKSKRNKCACFFTFRDILQKDRLVCIPKYRTSPLDFKLDLYRKFGSAYDVILIGLFKLDKVSAPAPNTHDKIGIFVGIVSCIQ